MSIPALVVRQRDFTGGQQDKELERRDDQPETRAAARQMANLRALAPGGARRRPGRVTVFLDSGRTLVVRPTPSTKFYFTFNDQSLVIRDDLKQVRHTFTGQPWLAALLYEITIQAVSSASLSKVIICYPTFRPRVVSYDNAADSWSIGSFAFAEDGNGATYEPFYRYVETGVTIQPSALTGAITLVASAAVFSSSAYVGNHIRYAGKQIEITAVADSTHASGTVLESLPPTHNVTVYSSGGFAIGDVVEGRTSGARGYVTAIPDATHLHVITISNYGGFSTSEQLVGPNSQTSVTTTSSTISPDPTFVWDEAFMTDYRGWPGSVSYDVQRLIFCRFPQIGRVILWSSIGDITDFKTGANADDSIFETVPENCIVQNVIGGADEFVMTDVGCYYIPISGGSPLRPGSVEFRLISSDAASTAWPAFTTEGLVFINYAKTRVLGIIGTGQSARPYIIQDTSELHSELINEPICLISSTGDTKAPERYLYLVNSDGTLVVGRYNARKSFAGWTPWPSDGFVRWSAVDRGDVLLMATYSLAAGDRDVVEVFDEDRKLDCAVTLFNGQGLDILEMTTGDPVELVGGGNIELSGAYQLEFAAGADFHFFDGQFYRGTQTIALDGSLVEDLDTDGYAPLYAGLNYIPTYEPFVPGAPEGQSQKQNMRRRRIKRIGMRVQDTNGFQVETEGSLRVVPAYRAGEDEEIAAPLRDETYMFRPLGRSYEPSVVLRQVVPGEFTLIECTMEVTV